MLIRVTNACRMGCSHCMVASRPDGDHMSIETFRQAMNLVERIGIPEPLLVSGGEPTDHPRLEELLSIARHASMFTLLLSNGLFLTQDSDRRDRILSLANGVQVTNDPRFYPTHVPDFIHTKVTTERHVRLISPFGRAKTNSVSSDRTAPLCFNLRSFCRGFDGDLPGSLFELRMRGFFCTPSVNVDGTVVAGEAPSCAPVGHVSDSVESLGRALAEMTCRKCGLFANLDATHLAAIEGRDTQTP